MNFNQIMAAIAELATAEKITKQTLSDLSRELLTFVTETEDVRPINALLGKGEDDKFILTPINWRITVQYFHHFLPFTSNFDEVKEFAIKGTGVRTPLTFAKKSKKRWDKCLVMIGDWLSDENNDVWLWSNHIEVKAKPVDYAKQVTSAVEKAMDEDKGNMSLSEVMSAILEADVGIEDLLNAISDTEEMEDNA